MFVIKKEIVLNDLFLNINKMNLHDFCRINWYILKTKIDWNWDRYNDWHPSVTTILKLIEDPWFNFVMERYKDQVEQSAARWTIVHDAAENFFNWNLVLTDSTEDIIKLNPNVSKFHSLFVKEILWMETRYEKDWVSGRIDLEALVNIRWNEYIANIDYKNAKVKSEKYKVQCGWYEWLNWKPWVLAYVNWKLELVQVESFYKDIFVELKDYFFYLLNNK